MFQIFQSLTTASDNFRASDQRRNQFQRDIRSRQKFTIDDAIVLLGGSWGLSQQLTTLSFITLFCVGSQFFYSIPFY